MVLKVLYENIKDKKKVLTGKRLEKIIEMNDKGVKAVTTDGSIYSGDILIGADGVHSTTRGQMWELAARLEPNYFDHEEVEGESSVP
jgi:2-polyprenyl-6-methoxyphenol hydroxylase-like FAD-dependent oxidoreductase